MDNLNTNQFQFNIYSMLKSNIQNLNAENTESDEEFEDNEIENEEMEWSQTSWERASFESDEDYQERMEDLGNFLDGF